VPVLFHPVFGSALTVLSGLSFLLVCMLLPLVGPAGAATVHADKNKWTFLAFLLVALVLSVLAIISKLERRKFDHSPLPHFSLLLCGLCLLLLIASLTGLLSI
jgi:ABC-type microcin C transport system permease subunit YejE